MIFFIYVRPSTLDLIVLTHLKLWHSGEDEHDDGGQEEQGAHDHQHLEGGGGVKESLNQHLPITITTMSITNTLSGRSRRVYTINQQPQSPTP